MTTLAGRTALITGGANGIGAAIARRFAQEGAALALLDADGEGLDRLAGELRTAGARVAACRCDVTAGDSLRGAVADAQAQLGGIDVLVNNAGGSGPRPVLDVEDIDDDVWDHVMALNLRSAFLCCKLVVPGMRERRYGRIVNMSSTLRDGLVGPLNTLNARLPYATAKSALVGFTRQLAKDLGPFGITVNAIAPGLIHADPQARIALKYRSLDPDSQRRMTAAIPAQRPGTGAEVAEAALFLASAGSSYVSGDLLRVDGGI